MTVCVRIWLSLTLDCPLEESLTGLAGRHAVVVARSHVTAHQAQPLGHCSQHEFTLHWAFFLPKPSQQRWKEGERKCN